MKENKKVVGELFKVDSEDKQGIIEPYLYTMGVGGKKIRLVMAIIIA